MLLAACGPRYPLGIPEEQWSRTTSAELTEARIQQQAELDRAQAEARVADAAARAAELEHARATAAPGERVQCIRAESFLRGQMHCELVVADSRIYRDRRLHP
ncbi:hypothetical protein [Guyparkeria sp.]|uniref:hypothetical protein n=1 Tax=Guyparkeria sp. TaxID=2035736 RepID=UPI003970810B